MKIAVVNGSPKGKYSITLQTVRYLEKKYPGHEFSVLHAGQRIKALERDFSPAAELLNSCEGIIFAYPVYTFLAPSQLHRFFELAKASGVDLRGKFATQISTSKHFYDMTAHKYVEENAFDMGMRYIRGLSADMEDLLT
ncbi:MAG: NAD(P)H-dependent oxidoreductase, partial [Clostridia bacterium]|nr:NAD(P)H-dependent oxidoreductase [Clostridia bacterium]